LVCPTSSSARARSGVGQPAGECTDTGPATGDARDPRRRARSRSLEDLTEAEPELERPVLRAAVERERDVHAHEAEPGRVAEPDADGVEELEIEVADGGKDVPRVIEDGGPEARRVLVAQLLVQDDGGPAAE